jgi:hypothetical protein
LSGLAAQRNRAAPGTVEAPDLGPGALALSPFTEPCPVLFATNGVPLAPEPALFAADRGRPAQALRLAEAARAGRADARGAGRLRLGADGERPRCRRRDLVGQGDLPRARATPCSPSTAA